MQDTRETLVWNLNIERVSADNECGEDIPENLRPQPRFKRGDVVLIPMYERPYEVDEVYWDYEFGGWLVVLSGSCIGVHESNFILAAEKDEWEPHKNRLWSWWTRKENHHASTP